MRVAWSSKSLVFGSERLPLYLTFGPHSNLEKPRCFSFAPGNPKIIPPWSQYLQIESIRSRWLQAPSSRPSLITLEVSPRHYIPYHTSSISCSSCWVWPFSAITSTTMDSRIHESLESCDLRSHSLDTWWAWLRGIRSTLTTFSKLEQSYGVRNASWRALDVVCQDGGVSQNASSVEAFWLYISTGLMITWVQQGKWYGNCDFADAGGENIRYLGYGPDPVRVE